MARPSADARLRNFDAVRVQVLSHPLAKGIEPARVQAFLAELPPQRFPRRSYAQRGKTACIQPRGGVPVFEAQQRLTRVLSDAGADFIPLTIDSCTRHNQYDTAALLLRRSEEEGVDYLNGYPLVSHGFELTRELYRGLAKPVSLRHGTPDARLLAEVAIASGIVEIEGGGICYCLPYSEGFPLDRCLLYWQYVDRLCALHSTADAPVHRESFGPLTATLVPPAIVVAIEIIEALLAAEQGVTSFAVSFGQTGSVIQDVATGRVLRRLTGEYLCEFGFDTVQHYLVYHQWMGQFPAERDRAGALIAASAVVAGLIDADKIVVKTVDEALGVPRFESNAAAVDCVRYVLQTFAVGEPVSSSLIDAEAELIEAEARAILRAVLDLPGESFWQGVYRAFREGYLDIPFSPHADNANAMITLRDAHGSIRIADPGRVPIGAAALRREQELVAGRVDRDQKTYRQLLADIRVMV
jgi:methylaspartate mutase epsilon subunit